MDEQAKLKWFRGRMLAFTSGLLGETDETRFHELLDSDPRCKQAYETFTEESEGPDSSGEHIPSALIARWDTARTELVGLERNMVRQHLERCADCRRDLEMLGHDPVLDEAPGQATVTAFPVERTQPRRSWNAGLAAWATLATAACLLLLLMPRDAPPVDGPGQGGFQLIAGKPHVRIEAKQRGSTVVEEPYPVQIRPRKPLVIRPRILVETLQTPEMVLSVLVFDPAGDVVVEGNVTAGDLDHGSFVFPPDPEWTAGAYRVELHSPDGELLDEYRIELTLAGVD